MAGQRTSPVLPPGWTGDTGFRHFESRTNLERLQPQLRLYRLERMEALLKKLGSPERTLPVVHIAGSKGKGSTAAYTTSLLAASGYTVGLYMSPHVTGYRERFSVIPPRRATGEVVEPTDPAAALLPGGDTYESALAETTYRIWSAVEEISRAGTEDDDLPTTFELLTALAFLFFPAVGCDWIVLETGLGGRLDATNVCRPEVAVITRIELEHTDYLGDTIEKIATEKAGIIKKGVPVVCAAQRHEAADVFRRIAAEREAPLTEIPAEEEVGSEGTVLSEGAAAPSDRRRTPGNLPWRGHAEIPGALLPPYDREPDDTFITLSPRMVGTVQRRNIIQALTVYRTLCEVRQFAGGSAGRRHRCGREGPAFPVGER